jgi:molybdopterin/thiamine biosynthesis adenylyltransferase
MSDRGEGRYERQMQLPEIGAEGQERLRRAHCLVIGAGGLGAPVLSYLCGAGVGHITLIDRDRVERSNLHRQVLFEESDCGQWKALATQKHLAALNPDCKVEAFFENFDPVKGRNLIEQVDCVVDCADNFGVTYAASDLCQKAGIPLISASVIGLQGYVGGFCGGRPSYRAVFPSPPQTAQSCASAGVTGPVCGIMGALQAQMVIHHLCAITPSPLGLLMRFDLTTFAVTKLDFSKAKEPDQGQMGWIGLEEITPEDCIVDLRGQDEGPLIHADARRVAMDALDKSQLGRPEQRHVLCCRTGLRSWKAGLRLQELGYDNCVLLAAGD